MNRPYDLLIFDWDGTLSDSAALIVGTMQQAIAGLGLPPRRDAQIRELIGLGLIEGLGLLYPDQDPQELQRVLGAYRKTWLQKVTVQEAPLFEGASATIEALHAAGYRISIATGKSRAGLDRALRAEPELARWVELSRTADETASKPDPLMVREILLESGVPAQRALVVGDTEYDAAMAAGAGVDALGVACGVHEPERIRAAGGLDVIAMASDLPDWLRARSAG